MRSNHINGIHGINDSGSDRHAAQGRNLPDGRSTFSQIFSDIDWQLPPDQLPSFHLFADNLYKFASQAQLTRCSKETLTSSTLALWALLQQRADEEIKLTLYNPPCNESNKGFTVLAVVLL